ncbi:MAG: hypothetical protein AB1640_11275 [bacterium]
MGRLGSTPLGPGRGAPAGQAYTEYLVILMVLFALGLGVSSVFVGFEQIHQIFFSYYSSLANFLNLPLF